MNKLFLCDLSKISCSWGDKSVAIQFFSDIISRGYRLCVIADNWNNPGKGVVFNKDKKKYRVDKKGYLFDPDVHTIDFFENLIKFTFPGEYHYTAVKIIEKADVEIEWDFRNGREWMKNGYNSIQTKFNLNPSLKNKDYELVKSEIEKTKNIVVTATWDDGMVFENTSGRTRGIFTYSDEFNKMKKFIEDLDLFCLNNPSHRLILVSKKAYDWDKILKSNFYDLRDFEKKNLSFSQSIHLLHNYSFISIGTESSFSIWLSMNPDCTHFVFGRFQGSEITNSKQYRALAEKKSLEYFGFKPQLQRKFYNLFRDYLKRSNYIKWIPKKFLGWLYKR